MAESEPKKKPRIRKSPTLREKREHAMQQKDTPVRKKRIRSVAGSVVKPAKKVHSVAKKEYYLPLPDNRLGRFLNKRRSVVPRYFINSWRELKQVTWPGRRETWRLTLAVFIFAFVFGVIIAIVDKGLDALFKKLILQ